MAQAGLTVSGTSQADAKAGHSDPTVSFRRSWSSTDKSYSGDNRLVSPKSSYRRRCSAPRCRLNLSWGWRRSQGYGCSPFKKLRELGSNRSEIKRLIPGQFESHETCKNIKEEYNCYLKFNNFRVYTLRWHFKKFSSMKKSRRKSRDPDPERASGIENQSHHGGHT